MYVSIPFAEFDDVCLSNTGHVIEGMDLGKNNQMPFWIKMSKQGDWFIDNITPRCF
jgi:hypothetical protein